MQKVATKKEDKQAQLEKDAKRALVLIEAYASLKEDQDKLKEDIAAKVQPFKDEFEATAKKLVAPYTDRLSSLDASVKESEKELLEIGERQKKKLFGTDGNWHFANGYYLHIKKETLVQLASTFDLSKYVKKFNDFIEVSFKIKELKDFFTNGDQRQKMVDMGLDLKQDETVEIKKKKEKDAKPVTE